jgi:hypothetical protein
VRPSGIFPCGTFSSTKLSTDNSLHAILRVLPT